MKFKYLLLLLLITVSFASIVSAQEQCNATKEPVYLFYSNTCPHCKNEIAFLKDLQQKYSQINIQYMEISANAEKYQEFAQKYNTTAAGVPRTFIGNKIFIGFSKEDGKLEYQPSYKAYIGYQNQLSSALFDYFGISSSIIPNPLQSSPIIFWILLILPIYLLTYPFLRKTLKAHHWRRYWLSGFFALILLCLFLIVILTPQTAIKDFAQTLPFPLFVFVIALADGFNPCAFTVLIILLSLLTYTKDKKSMLILGLTFIIASALMYFIFIIVMIFVGAWALQTYGPIIMTFLGVLILFAGIINVKDFFFFQKGVSLSISDEHKLKFSHHARKITHSLIESKTMKTLLFAIGGTFILATLVNIIELGCTAILPAIYMVSLVNTFGNSITFSHILWTLFYALIYVIPLLAILLNFIYTFKSTRLTEHQGRILKLVAGLFMLTFGIIMIFKPELLLFG